MRAPAVLLVALLAGCGGGEPSGPSPAPQPPSERERLEQTIAAWAPLFAAGERGMCEHTATPLQDACHLPRSPYVGAPSRWQRSFAGATVSRVRVAGERARVRLSNGEEVRAERFGARWYVVSVGG